MISITTLNSVAEEFLIEFKAVDKDDNQALPSATVRVNLIEQAQKVKVFKTNINGNFKLETKLPIELVISYMGYETFTDTIDIIKYNSVYSGKLKEIYLTRSTVYFNEIVTTGQFAPSTSQKSVFPIKVINREQLQAQSVPNLRDLLTTEMNLQINQDGILGSSLRINGLSGQNVKIMIDGVPVVGRLDGNLDISQINLTNAERVEIIKGPMSTIYGTDALGGVVNIITNTRASEGLKSNINSYYETAGVYNFDGLLSYRKDKHTLSLSGGRYFFGGYSEQDTSRFKEWKPKIQYFSDMNYRYIINPSHTVRTSSRFYYDYILNRGNLRPPRMVTAFDDTYETYRLTNSIFYNGRVARDKYVESTISYSNYQRQKHSYIKDMVTLNLQKTNNPEDHSVDKFNSLLLRTTYSNDNPNSTFSYQAGFDINLDEAAGDRIDGSSKHIDDYALFLSFQFKPLMSIVLQPSVRFIYNTRYDAPIVPAFNIKYSLTDEFTLRASYARGFRAPSIRELYLLFVDVNHNIQSDENLIAETSHSYNIEFNYHINKNSHVLQIEPSLFYNDISNLITLAITEPQEQLYSYINIGEYRTLGGSLTFNYFRNNIAAKFGYTLIGSFNEYSTEFENLREYNFAPAAQANILYDFKSIGGKLGLFYKFSGRHPGFTIIEDEIAEYYIDEFHLFDATWSQDIIDGKVNLVLGVKNIFDVSNIKLTAARAGGYHSTGTTSESVAWGRTFFTTLRINL